MKVIFLSYVWTVLNFCVLNPQLPPAAAVISIAEFLESKQLMELIARLEDHFDIDIPYDDRNEDNFYSVDTIIELLERLQ